MCWIWDCVRLCYEWNKMAVTINNPRQKKCIVATVTAWERAKMKRVGSLFTDQANVSKKKRILRWNIQWWTGESAVTHNWTHPQWLDLYMPQFVSALCNKQTIMSSCYVNSVNRGQTDRSWETDSSHVRKLWTNFWIFITVLQLSWHAAPFTLKTNTLP